MKHKSDVSDSQTTRKLDCRQQFIFKTLKIKTNKLKEERSIIEKMIEIGSKNKCQFFSKF